MRKMWKIIDNWTILLHMMTSMHPGLCHFVTDGSIRTKLNAIVQVNRRRSLDCAINPSSYKL